MTYACHASPAARIPHPNRINMAQKIPRLSGFPDTIPDSICSTAERSKRWIENCWITSPSAITNSKDASGQHLQSHSKIDTQKRTRRYEGRERKCPCINGGRGGRLRWCYWNAVVEPIREACQPLAARLPAGYRRWWFWGRWGWIAKAVQHTSSDVIPRVWGGFLDW